MWAKQHLFYGFMFWLIPLFIIVFNSSSSMFYIFFTAFFFMASIGYFIGLILPDSDSNNKGSKIYYTMFKPLAHICSFIEQKKAHKHGFSVGHRGFLHHPKGMLMTSLVPAIVGALITLIFARNLYSSLFNLISIYAGTLIGQLVHLVQDSIAN